MLNYAERNRKHSLKLMITRDGFRYLVLASSLGFIETKCHCVYRSILARHFAEGDNRMKKCAMVILGLALLLGGVSCNQPGSPSAATSLEDAIIGTWQQIDVADGETLQFFVDGTMSTTKYGQSFGCDYTFIDKSQVKLDCLGGLLGYVYEVAVSQDTLVMTDTESGEVYRYQRVQ